MISRFGGKGKGLLALKNLNLPIPAYELIDVQKTDSWLESLIPNYRRLLATCAQWKSPDVEESLSDLERSCSLSDSIFKRRLKEHPFPIDFSLLQSTLDSPNWIIRSSMSIEDSKDSSFAGCFHSIPLLGPRSDGVREAEFQEACFQVLTSALKMSSLIRILSTGADLREFRPGLLIQKYISPILSGVCFSRNPVRLWNPKEGLVEWSDRPEGVVQGNLSSGVAFQKGPCPEALTSFWNLIWSYSDQIEAALKGPSEWEWVWDGGKLWVVQARPIATPEARLIAQTRPGRRWSRELTLERFPKPLTPMGWSALQDVFIENLKSLERQFGISAKNPEEVAISLNGVIYSDPGFFKFPTGVSIDWKLYLNPLKKRFWRLFFRGATYLSVALLEKLSSGRTPSSSIELLRKKSLKSKKALCQLKIIDALLENQARTIEQTWEGHRETSLLKLEKFKSEIQKGKKLTEEEILIEMEVLRKLSIHFLEPDLAIFLIKDTYFKSILNLWTALGKKPADLTPLIRLSNENVTLEMNEEWNQFLDHFLQEEESTAELFLNRLNQSKNSQEILESATVLRSTTSASWKRFLLRNGHQRTSWDIAVPSWSEDASQWISILNVEKMRAHLRESQPKSRRTSFGNENSNGKLLALFRDELGLSEQSPQFQWIKSTLNRLEQFMRIDEEQHHLSGRVLDPSRELVLAGGMCLFQQGLLTQVEDVFFLELNELKSQLALSPDRRIFLEFLTQKRKADWKRICQTKPLSILGASEMGYLDQNPYDVSARLGTSPDFSSSQTWIGQPVSAGEAVGVVHYLEQLSDVKDLPAEAVAIALSPNPALTPVFPLLAGLITVTGGPLSHGFVAAREHGLPAVSGIENAFEIFRPGMKVRMNGSSGKVERLEI